MKLFENITGFIDFGFEKNNSFHKKSYNLVSGRSGINFIIKIHNFKKIFIPHYLCEDVTKNLKIPYELYYLNSDLTPKFDFKNLEKNNAILIVNYFGILDLNKTYKKKSNIIFDSTHSYYSKITKANIVYSARKFFPVPDGGHLYLNKKFINPKIKKNYPKNIDFLYLKNLGRYDEAYKKYRINEKNKNLNKLLRISDISNKILQSINYKKDIKIRKRNFKSYQKIFKSINKLKIQSTNTIPMCYPLLLNKNIKLKLKKHKIFIPTFWKELREKLPRNSIEMKLVKHLHCLPIDMRIKLKDTINISKIVKKYL